MVLMSILLLLYIQYIMVYEGKKTAPSARGEGKENTVQYFVNIVYI